ncbi:hypothetical protein KGO95_04420, partial [Patescibacteria group bacterium]|nr:hypothetical protein [Patescibacteria group bacterium]
MNTKKIFLGLGTIGVLCVLTVGLMPAMSHADTVIGGSTPAAPANTAQQHGTQTITLPNPLGTTSTIPGLISKIVDWLIMIASVAVLPFMIIWGAFQMLGAGSNPEKVTEGRHTITWAVIGYALLLLSKSIELIIQQ